MKSSISSRPEKLSQRPVRLLGSVILRHLFLRRPFRPPDRAHGPLRPDQGGPGQLPDRTVGWMEGGEADFPWVPTTRAGASSPPSFSACGPRCRGVYGVTISGILRASSWGCWGPTTAGCWTPSSCGRRHGVRVFHHPAGHSAAGNFRDPGIAHGHFRHLYRRLGQVCPHHSGQRAGDQGNAYVLAAKSSGAGDFRILFRHILPNALPPSS
jgi:hypothetical protein